MKKLLSLSLAIILLFGGVSSVPFSANAALAASGSCGENVNYTFDSTTGLLTISGNGAMTNYSKPSDSPFYADRTSIKSVVICDGVTTVGTYAFYWATSMSSLIIADSVTAIGNYSFYYCKSIKELTLPCSVKIGVNDATMDTVFSNCTSIEKVTFTKGTGVCQDYTSTWDKTPWVRSKSNLKEAVIEEGVLNIGAYLFCECYKMETLYIPASVTDFGDEAFSTCRALKNIIETGEEADGVLISEDGTELVRFGNPNISEYTVPDGVTSIRKEAFYNTQTLTKVTLSPSVKTVGALAFYGCTALGDITVPDSVKEIKEDAFRDTAYYNNNDNWTDGALLIGSFLCNTDSTVSGTYTVPQEITSICSNAFKQNTNITEIKADNVKYIGVYAFSDCTALQSVSLKNIEEIDSSAFAYCKNLSTVNLGNGIKTISGGVFSGCSALEDITLPEGLTKIGNSAFRSCSALKSIMIPDSVTELGEYVFYYCTALESATIGNGVTAIKYHAFDGCTSLTQLKMGTGVTTIETWAFDGCSALTTLKLGRNVQIINERAFEDCGRIETVFVPKTLKLVYPWAFNYSRAISTVYYEGTYAEWKDINIIDTENDYFIKAKMGFNYRYPDTSVLKTVLNHIGSMDENDYLDTSFEELKALYNKYVDGVDDIDFQDDVDAQTEELLTAVETLSPFLVLAVTATDGGSVSVSISGEEKEGESFSVLYGTNVKLKADPKEGYRFIGWYESVSKRIFSDKPFYRFSLSANTDYNAMFVKEDNALLIFKNDTGQIVSVIEKPYEEWEEVTSLDELLPCVPYKYGHQNGAWSYNEATVLRKLRNGIDMEITPVYEEAEASFPDAGTATDSTPVLALSYQYDSDNSVASFVMNVALPDNCDIEAVGTAFYYQKANSFDPNGYILTVNNKTMTSKFDNTDDGIYITNLHHFSASYNWCARGYVTYYDSDGNIKTAYSDQINIVNMQQV